jgi:hypothetical protein
MAKTKSGATLPELIEQFAMAVETKDTKLQKSVKLQMLTFHVNGVEEIHEDKVVEPIKKTTKKASRQSKTVPPPKKVVKKTTKSAKTTKKVKSSSQQVVPKVVEDISDFEPKKKAGRAKRDRTNQFVDDGGSASVNGEKIADKMPPKHKKFDNKLAKAEPQTIKRQPARLIKATCSLCGKVDDNIDTNLLADWDENGRPCKRAYRCNSCVIPKG